MPSSKAAYAERRHQARVLAFQVLFEVDLTGHDRDEVFARHAEHHALPADDQAFAERLVDGWAGNHAAIDERLAAAAPSWPLDQMSRVDKNILRLALQEVLFDNAAPLKTAINEAVELAKTYGSDTSPRFVNGVLGSVATGLRPTLPAGPIQA
jgi:N utilization substance protein B